MYQSYIITSLLKLEIEYESIGCFNIKLKSTLNLISSKHGLKFKKFNKKSKNMKLNY